MMIRVGVLGLMWLLVAAVVPAAPPDFETVVLQNQPAVVVLIGRRVSNGNEVQSSGCVIDTRGYVLTTAHQIANVADLRGRLHDGSECRLETVEVDENQELALLKADRPLPRAAALGDARQLNSASPIIAIAAPRSLDFTTVAGVVSSTDRVYKSYPVIQADLNASPGSSGGPGFDRQGALVGLIIGKLKDEDWITVVNPINNAYPMLQRHGLRETAVANDLEWELTPVPGLDQRTLRALEAYNAGVRAADPARKASHYRTAVELLPQFFEAWFNLAVASGRQGDWGQAEAAYARAQELAPDSVAVLRNLGRIYLRQDRLEDAAEVFTAARELDPNQAQSYNDLGEVLRRLKRMDEARQAFEEAVRLESDYAPARYNLALIHAGNGENGLAATEFRKYLELAPAAPEAAQVRAWIEQLEDQ